jgi:hypothetical protein
VARATGSLYSDAGPFEEADMSTTAEKRARFRALHESGFFIIPNAWDGGSAKRLEALGFKAIASTSAGAAWAAGKDDGELGRDAVLDHLRQLVAATDLPVNADFENGFDDGPEGVATSRWRWRPGSPAFRSRIGRAAACTRWGRPSIASPPPARRSMRSIRP